MVRNAFNLDLPRFAAYLGISDHEMSQIENGTIKAKKHILERMIDIFYLLDEWLLNDVPPVIGEIAFKNMSNKYEPEAIIQDKDIDRSPRIVRHLCRMGIERRLMALETSKRKNEIIDEINRTAEFLIKEFFWFYNRHKEEKINLFRTSPALRAKFLEELHN
jgi:transcriptional regulator with XRE-family HTH domain